MAQFEHLLVTFAPPEVAPANALDWSCGGLKRIPKELPLDCESLNARENCFTYVHIRLKRLTNLVSLDMSHNNFSSVPVAIFGLPRLEYLNLSHNNLRSADCNFPAWCNSISTVILDHNLLVDLPTWWIQAPSLAKLSINFNSLQPQYEKIQERFKVLGATESRFPNKSSVQVLCMSNCGLTQLPMWLQALANPSEIHISNVPQKNSLLNQITDLEQLVKSHLSSKTQVLNLANIRLSTLPDDIDHLAKLRVFFLQRNIFSFLPNSFGRLTNLEFCDLSECNLTDLPPTFDGLINLKTLILYGNKLSYLSKGLENLTNLEYIDLYCNCLDSYPTEVLNISRLRCFDTEMNLFDSAIILTHEEFQAYETKLNCIRSKLEVERKLGAFPQMNKYAGSNDESEDVDASCGSDFNDTQIASYKPFRLMPTAISLDDSEEDSIASQQSSLQPLSCDEEWTLVSELDSPDDDDLKLQSKATTPVKYAWMSDEEWISWKALPNLETLIIPEEGKFDDLEDSSDGVDA